MGAPHATPIGDYGVVGDCRSAALVSKAGSIDWLCWPRFDSPSVFAALLDRAGGRFAISPAAGARARRRYVPHTNVLETRFESAGGVLLLLDAMPVAADEERSGLLLPERQLVRLARCEQGDVDVEVVYEPRLGYGRWPMRWHDRGKLGLQAHSGRHLLVLRSDAPLTFSTGGRATGRFRLRAGEEARFSLVYAEETPAVLPPLDEIPREIDRTVRFWRSWAERVRYAGPYRAEVVRSALALKLLAYSPSGAVIAAPTTSLPERPGGDLNWDYRYCWLRDASFTVRALFGLGFAEEADAFTGWLLHSTRLSRPALDVLYDVYGRPAPREHELPELEGYCGSRPVRIGNAARNQVQLDVYGEVIDAATQSVRAGVTLDRDTGRMLADFGRYVCRHWREPDEGIWEPRGARRQHTFSKVLCWVALDRLVALHRRGHVPDAPAEEFALERQAIRRHIDARAWNPEARAYSSRLDADAVDASLLLLPWYGYLRADSPRMRGTFARIDRELRAGGGLLYRYPESRDVAEGAFGICGFWAAECLALGTGSVEAACARLEKLLACGNDLGLFAEEVDPATGAAVGNFPQAFTHVGLINAALTLQNRLLGREQLRHQRRLPAAAVEQEQAVSP